MSRFFKSAAFPILIVVVLAFFAQKLISPDTQTTKPEFSTFLQQLDAGQVKSAVIKTKDNTVAVTTTDQADPPNQKYEVGYPTTTATSSSTSSVSPRSSSTWRGVSPTPGFRC